MPLLALATMQTELYPFKREQDREMFYSLTQELRCLVCQNQTLTDSEAPLAKDLRRDIYVQINKGHSKQQILNYLTTRYGNFILYSPPLKPNTYILWFFPVLLILIAITILVVIHYKTAIPEAFQVASRRRPREQRNEDQQHPRSLEGDGYKTRNGDDV